MLAVQILVLVVILTVAFAERVTLEAGTHLESPLHWARESLDSSSEVSAVFVMNKCEKKMKELEAKLYDLSTPSSANYGKWLSKDEIVETYLGVSDERLDTVVNFLKEAGVKNVRVSELKDKIFVKMPVHLAETVLETKFALFRSKDRAHVVLPRITQPYSLPENIARYVALVDDITRFPTVAAPLRMPMPTADVGASSTDFQCGTSCSGSTTPAVIGAAYGMTYPIASAAAGNGVAVAEFQGQYYDQADITNFDTACNANSEVDVTIGGNTATSCAAGACTEALLDIEYLGAMTTPVPLTVIYTNAYSLQTWIDTVIALPSPFPWVHSVSYGNDEVQQTSVAYMNTVNAQFMAAGAMGLSILVASGDQGVWGRTGVKRGNTFHPDFPGDSPYVTTVGGTNFVTKSVIGAESAWDCGGGGFSNVFSQPSFQSDVVNAYLDGGAASILPPSSHFNATGRGYPDVSALGGQTNPYCVGNGGQLEGVWGTSAACPVVASVFTQLNNIRLAAGKPSLGWLNPFIYSNTDCFNDVTSGMNNCNTGTQGFTAVPGWDAATGNGSPNYICLSTRI